MAGGSIRRRERRDRGRKFVVVLLPILPRPECPMREEKNVASMHNGPPV